MKIVNKMVSGKYYLIRKEIIGINEFQVYSWEYSRFEENLNRFILPFAELLGFALTGTELLMIIKPHPENRKLPKFVEDQKYLLTAADLPEYLTGKMKALHNSKHNCAKLDPVWVVRKK